MVASLCECNSFNQRFSNILT